ncbi:MAG TPA: DUF4386 family protein [Candidatus Limnocylindria bacterium]
MAVSAQTYARIAGVLFLISAVAGGFGEFFVPLQLIVSNDATATANNIMSSRRPRIRDQELRVGPGADIRVLGPASAYGRRGPRTDRVVVKGVDWPRDSVELRGVEPLTS